MRTGSYVSVRTIKASTGKWRVSDSATSAANRSMAKPKAKPTGKPKGKPKSKRTSKAQTPSRSDKRAVQLIARESGDSLAREIALAERKARYEELVRKERLAQIGEYL